jgi:hypothetical protein
MKEILEELFRRASNLSNRFTSNNRKKKIIAILSVSLLMILFITMVYKFSTLEEVGSASPQDKVICNISSQGTVVKEGPYGNPNSPVKIVYILGQHPRESDVHQAVQETVKSKSKSLQYCYYLYNINVTDNPEEFDTGRMNGQLLSNQYVLPDIQASNYSLAVDVHSYCNIYPEEPIIFSPISNEPSESVALNLSEKISWLKYYHLPYSTSPEYTTIPLIEGGTPSIVFESLKYDPYNLTKERVDEFISKLDKLDLKPILK